jgi:hypothetical protein
VGTDGCTQREGRYQHVGNLSVLDGARRQRRTALCGMYYMQGSSQFDWYPLLRAVPRSKVTVTTVPSTVAAAGRHHAEGHLEEKMSRGTKSACGAKCRSSRAPIISSQFCIDKSFKHELNHIGMQLIGNAEAQCKLMSFDRSRN